MKTETIKKVFYMILFLVMPSIITAQYSGGIGGGSYSITTLSQSTLPVEMESFAYTVIRNNVNLEWKTVSELNNQGFDIEKKSVSTDWAKIGFVSSNRNKTYSYNDNNLNSGTYEYRLKQIDYNGNFEYFNLNSVVVISNPKKVKLSQNYPNPFNPVTSISFEIPQNEFVSLKVYDMLGKEVSDLISENKNAGYYTIEFNGNNLPSGIYFYKLSAGTFSEIKKMILIK
jgi:hypothetical protein